MLVGAPAHLSGKAGSPFRSLPILSITSRPDILPTWLRAMGLASSDIIAGASVEHHYLALPAVLSGKCLPVAPDIVVGHYVRDGMLKVIDNTRTPSDTHYSAYALDRSANPELAHAFCRWLARLCRTMPGGELR